MLYRCGAVAEREPDGFGYRFTLLLELSRFDGKNVIRRASFPREKLELSE